MPKDERCRREMHLTKVVAGTQIDVSFDDEQQLGETYSLLGRLSERVRNEEMGVTLNGLWIRRGDQCMASETVSETMHRAAMLLFQSWPGLTSVSDIQTETGLSQGYVSNIVAGHQGDVGHWCIKQGDLRGLPQVEANAVYEIIAPNALAIQREANLNE